MFPRTQSHLHGGELNVANRASGGAVVTLVFPASRGVGGALPEVAEPPRRELEALA